jgi:hypothetical protein
MKISKLNYFMLLLLVLSACTYENELEKYGIRDCTDATFSQSIQPIIQSKCALSGCHVNSTGLPDFTDFENIKSRAAGIKSRTSSGNMPPASSGISLTRAEIDAISCWVDQGTIAD